MNDTLMNDFHSYEWQFFGKLKFWSLSWTTLWEFIMNVIYLYDPRLSLWTTFFWNFIVVHKCVGVYCQELAWTFSVSAKTCLGTREMKKSICFAAFGWSTFIFLEARKLLLWKLSWIILTIFGDRDSYCTASYWWVNTFTKKNSVGLNLSYTVYLFNSLLIIYTHQTYKLCTY